MRADRQQVRHGTHRVQAWTFGVGHGQKFSISSAAPRQASPQLEWPQVLARPRKGGKQIRNDGSSEGWYSIGPPAGGGQAFRPIAILLNYLLDRVLPNGGVQAGNTIQQASSGALNKGAVRPSIGA